MFDTGGSERDLERRYFVYSIIYFIFWVRVKVFGFGIQGFGILVYLMGSHGGIGQSYTALGVEVREIGGGLC